MEQPEHPQPSDSTTTSAPEASTLNVSIEEELQLSLTRLRTQVAEAVSLLATAREHGDTIASVKAQADGLLAAMQGTTGDVQALSAAVLAANQQIQNVQASVEASEKSIQDAQKAVENAKGEVSAKLASCSEAAGHATSTLELMQQSSHQATTILEAIQATNASMEEPAKAISAARRAADAHVSTLKTLSETSKEVDARIKFYEERLMVFDREADALLKTIQSLLPGATSAGLASAFDQRRQSFLKPSARWQWLFVGSVIALVVLALTGFWGVSRSEFGVRYESILSMWLVRLPIAAALVWLALHSSRESALAKRLEEDYGFKAAMASSFQGFQRQMAEIGEKAAEGSPLRTLCEDTLATISSPPGRIYEKQSLTVTPSSEAFGVARAMTDVLGQGRAGP